MLHRRTGVAEWTFACALVLRQRVFVWLAIACIGLTGCGGGGGGGGVRSQPTPPPHVSFSPATVTAKAQFGAPISFRVSATFTQEAIDESDHIEFDDLGGFIDGIDVVGQSQSTRTLELEAYVSRQLAIGEHTGTLNFYICEDENCRTTMKGSPFALPYTIIVEPIQTPVIQPSVLSVTAQTDEAKTASLTVQFSAPVPAVFAVSDPAERFENEFETSQQGASYSLQLRTIPMSAPGTYSGALSLLVCTTTPCSVQNQALNGPISVPYTITVIPEIVLQPVPTTSGLPEWETHQGNAGHTGHVPVTLNAAQFAPRWNWTSGDTNTNLSPATTGSGKVAVSASGYFNSASIIVLNEADGSLAWRHDFGETFSANHPAVWGGRVFAATSGHEATAMWSFDLADGSVESRTNFDSQWEHYLAPTIKDGHVFTNGGYYGGMYSFRGIDGTKRWFAGLQQYDLWTPAVDERYAYAHTGYELAIIDRRDGARVATIPNSSFNWRGYALNIAPVLPGDGSVLVVDGIYNFSSPHANSLIRYDVATRSESWRISGSFVSNPVVAANRVYVLNTDANRLEARDLSTGTLLWSWVVPDAQESLPVGNAIVTENLIFFCTTAATYAIDLNSRAVVWREPKVGHLALSSNKVLYIVAPRSIDAFDLD